MKKTTVRKWVQLFFFVLVGAIAINHTLAESGSGIPLLSSASLHAICPFGGVETMYNLVTTGILVKKVHLSSVVMLGIVAALAVLFGPVFCGWVCPVGTAQEWVGKLGKKLLGKRYNRMVPPSIDKVLRYARYLVLAWAIYVTAKSGTLIFTAIDPFHAMFQFWTGEVAISALVILGVVLLGSLFMERPWCKYACPLGAVLGLSNFFRIFKIQRAPSTCINCKACDRACPMNITVSDKTAVRDHQCISCLECTSEAACPVNNTVDLQAGKEEAVQ